MRVLDPTDAASAQHSAVSLGGLPLRGATIGIIDNAKPNFDLIADQIATTLARDHGVRDRIVDEKPASSVPADADVYWKMAQRCQLVIAGSGD